jgi:peptidyl-prolyl cis-trans isomerase C
MLVVVTGCGKHSPESETMPAPHTAIIATVDGQPVSQALFDRYVERESGVATDQVDATSRQRLMDKFLELEAAAAAGSRLATAGVTQDAELARLDVLAKAAAQDAHVYDPPSLSDLQAAYQVFVTSLPDKEYHVAHILVATDSLAREVISDLDRGTDFAQEAKLRSADESRLRGGNLGWVSPGHLPKALTDAAAELKPGQYTRQAIQTSYGWHVIRLIDVRPATAPPFDQVKAQIVVNLQMDRYGKFLKSVAARASIERLPMTTPAK